MQHELFHSKLKPSVESSSLLEIIRSSSAGETPHRATAMELTFERSIQEHKERMVARAKESKLQSPPAKPPATDEKPAAVKPTLVTGEKSPVVKPTPVTNEKPATAKPTPVKSEQKQAPSSKRIHQKDCQCFLCRYLDKERV
jgi:hypothetical protein